MRRQIVVHRALKEVHISASISSIDSAHIAADRYVADDTEIAVFKPASMQASPRPMINTSLPSLQCRPSFQHAAYRRGDSTRWYRMRSSYLAAASSDVAMYLLRLLQTMPFSRRHSLAMASASSSTFMKQCARYYSIGGRRSSAAAYPVMGISMYAVIDDDKKWRRQKAIATMSCQKPQPGTSIAS